MASKIMTTEETTIKLLKKGIRINGQYFSCFYSPASNNCNGNATIYIRSWDSLPSEAYKVLNVQNDSDGMTDYFEKDRIRIAPGHPLFNGVEELAVK